MLRNKKVNILIALITALSLWAYVTGSIDPNITKKYSKVPIKIVNQESLIKDGLAVDSVATTEIDVTLTGTRADLNDIDKNDIQITADLYNRHKGDNYVPIDVQLPKGIELDSKSIEKLLVVIDDLVTEERDVEAKVTGTMPEKTTLGEADINPETMQIYGTESNVKKVDYVEATVDADKLKEETTKQVAEVTPVDKNGKTVDFVTTSRSTADVEAKLLKYKTVKLDVETTGEIDSKYELSSIDIPKEVEIAGEADVLDDISSIEANDVDISGVTKSTKLKVEPILPSGVTLKSDEGIYVTIVIKEPEEKTIHFAGADVVIENLASGMEGNITEAVTVTLKGKLTTISAIQKSDIKLYVDAEGLNVGEHKVEIKITGVRSDVTATVSPATVNLKISEE